MGPWEGEGRPYPIPHDLQRPLPCTRLAAPRLRAGRAPAPPARPGGQGWVVGCSPYSHLSGANPITPLMKSGCAANEITLQRPAGLRSAAALSRGPAVLGGTLCPEPSGLPRSTGSRPLAQRASRQKGAENCSEQTPVPAFTSLRAWVCSGSCVLGGDTASQVSHASPGRVARVSGRQLLSAALLGAAQLRRNVLMNVSHKLAEKRPSA